MPFPRWERAGRVKVGHQMIGQMLSGWPAGSGRHVAKQARIREVIEELSSTHLEQGFGMGVYNSRGAVVKDPSVGGASERMLAERYEGLAAAIRAAYPRTAGMLRDIGVLYRRAASREDFESEMVEAL